MRRCAKCDLVPRWDDPLTMTEERLRVCRDCLSADDAPVLYPKGQPVPSHPNNPDRDLPICGSCRRALREDDSVQQVFLTDEDVEGTDEDRGIHLCCADCRARWGKTRKTGGVWVE